MSEASPRLKWAAVNFAQHEVSGVRSQVLNDDSRDNDPTLLPELDGMIERFGADSLAEDFLRSE